jgi:hypothetical protein
MNSTVGHGPPNDDEDLRPSTWDALLHKYDDQADGRIIAEEVIGAGGFIEFYLDYLRLPTDERRTLRPILGPAAFVRFEEVREAAGVFRIADAKAGLDKDAALWFERHGFRRLARPAIVASMTLDELLAKWDSGQDGRISGEELGSKLNRGAEFLLDFVQLPAEEQISALACLDPDARHLFERAGNLYQGMLATEEIQRLGSLPGEEA